MLFISGYQHPFEARWGFLALPRQAKDLACLRTHGARGQLHFFLVDPWQVGRMSQWASLTRGSVLILLPSFSPKLFSAIVRCRSLSNACAEPSMKFCRRIVHIVHPDQDATNAPMFAQDLFTLYAARS